MDEIPTEWRQAIVNNVCMGGIDPCEALPLGAIVGYADLVDVVEVGSMSDSLWDCGKDCAKFVFENAHVFDEPIVVKGKLGFWDYDIDENNLPPNHVALPQVIANGTELQLPLTAEYFKDCIEEDEGFLALYTTDQMLDAIMFDNVEENCRMVKPFETIAINLPDGSVHRYELPEGVLIYDDLDENDNPVKEPGLYSDEEPVKYFGIQLGKEL